MAKKKSLYLLLPGPIEIQLLNHLLWIFNQYYDLCYLQDKLIPTKTSPQVLTFTKNRKNKFAKQVKRMDAFNKDTAKF